MTVVLFVCTANRCRSPMAAAVLRQRLPLSAGVEVRSAGLLPAGFPAPEEADAVVRRYGLDLTNHLSRQVKAADLRHADLILGMTRAHVRELTAQAPDAWDRTFTFKDFVHRIEDGEYDFVGDPAATLSEIAAYRDRDSVLGADPNDEIRDPMGESFAVWTAVTNEIVDYCDRLALALTDAPEMLQPSRRSRHRR